MPIKDISRLREAKSDTSPVRISPSMNQASARFLARRDGRFDDTLYWFDQSTGQIYHSEWDGKARPVKHVRDAFFKEVHVAGLRFSPDERLIATRTALSLKSAIPTPQKPQPAREHY